MLKSLLNVSTILPISFHPFSPDGGTGVHIVFPEDSIASVLKKRYKLPTSTSHKVTLHIVVMYYKH